MGLKELFDEEKHIKNLANFKKTEEELNHKIMKLENIKRTKQICISAVIYSMKAMKN